MMKLSSLFLCGSSWRLCAFARTARLEEESLTQRRKHPKQPKVKTGPWLLLVFIGLLTLASCQASSMGSAKPLSAAALSEEYAKSSAEVRRKYDGKEIIVAGYTAEAAIVPGPDDDQGLVLLAERDTKPAQQVACWFSEDQAAQFSTIKGGQFITVKGIFNGEAGVDLRFCKLVKQGKEN